MVADMAVELLLVGEAVVDSVEEAVVGVVMAVGAVVGMETAAATRSSLLIRLIYNVSHTPAPSLLANGPFSFSPGIIHARLRG